jgi:hypothetical protein
LKALNLLLEELDVFSCSPHNDLLTPLDISSEAYCLADIGRHTPSISLTVAMPLNWTPGCLRTP